MKKVDSCRFISGITKRMIKSWINMERPREFPWTPLVRPLHDCTVSLISTAGIVLRSDRPFDQEGERRNPWWGDPSYRILPATATRQDVWIYHQHIDPSYAGQDLNCLFRSSDWVSRPRPARSVGRRRHRVSAGPHPATGVLLLKRRPLAYTVAPAFIVFLILTGVPILITPVVQVVRGETAQLGRGRANRCAYRNAASDVNMAACDDTGPQAVIPFEGGNKAHGI